MPINERVQPSPLTVAVKDHFGQAMPYARALQQAGHLFTASGPADLLLIDYDCPAFGYQRVIEQYKAMGATVLMYPHGAGSVGRAYDGLFEPCELVDAAIVHGPGSAEALRRVGYPRPAYVAGWTLCEQRPFAPRDGAGTVLFAPLHPSGDGSLVDEFRDANAATYAALLDGPWQLIVRHLGTLEQNGLWHADGVQYVTGRMDLGYAEIDAADVVVAGEGTLPMLAVARGVPTVMYEQLVPARWGFKDEPPSTLRTLERYRDYTRYPLDVADGPLDELLHAAATGARAADVETWRRRHVGTPFDAPAFAALAERLVHTGPQPVEIDETRAFTVVGFADEVCERPELLAGYAECFGPDDDATLILWAPGCDAATGLDMVEHAATAAGLDESRLPDVLLLPLPGSRDADAALAERADAVLSEWPAVGRLGQRPCVGAGDVASLAARVPAGQR